MPPKKRQRVDALDVPKMCVKTVTRACYLGNNVASQAVRDKINADVCAVSTATRLGSRFLELQLRMLLDAGTFPDDFPWSRAVCQAFAAMQARANPTKPCVGYYEADVVWQKLHPRSQHGVHLVAANSLTYESNAYYSTLLSNYTTCALASHVFWTLRYLFPAHRRALKRAIIQHSTAALEDVPIVCLEFIKRCHAIQDAKFSPKTATQALLLRWECLKRIADVDAVVDEESRRYHPRRFTLVPTCRKAARFITLDVQWANAALGKPRRPPKVGDRSAYDNALASLFRLRRSKFRFPDTVKSDGVQLHVPYTKLIVETDKRFRDATCRNPDVFASATTGLFRLEAANQLSEMHPGFHNAVGVDPGVRNLVTTSSGVKITRGDFYGRRAKSVVFDPGTETAPTPHSRRIRHGAVPIRIAVMQASFLENKTCTMSVTDAFVTNLEAWLTCAKELQTYYGTRTHRAVRLTRASRGRRSMDRVVNTIAPDPKTIVVFGANFYGRPCRFGDVAGPVVVKGIRRKLAKHRVVVVVDEYNTTKCHLTCGQVMQTALHDAREKVCGTCGGVAVDRDRNAAENILAVWRSYVQNRTRPAHLRRLVVDDL